MLENMTIQEAIQKRKFFRVSTPYLAWFAACPSQLAPFWPPSVPSWWDLIPLHLIRPLWCTLLLLPASRHPPNERSLLLFANSFQWLVLTPASPSSLHLPKGKKLIRENLILVFLGLLYYIDYNILEGIKRYEGDKPRFVSSPICLFFVNKQKQLMPVAIQLHQSGYVPLHPPMSTRLVPDLPFHPQALARAPKRSHSGSGVLDRPVGTTLTDPFSIRT